MIRVPTQAALVEAIADRLALKRPVTARRVIAIVGAPGSGKSTLAEILAEALAEFIDPEAVCVVPMDGFHLDNRLLEPAGLLSVKGAPATFDVAGLACMLGRIAADDAPVYLPWFDRRMDLARAGALEVRSQHRLILVEGNYLLLQRQGWHELGQHFDLTIRLDVPWSELRDRLVRRWREHGHELDAAVARAEANDLPNGRIVERESAEAHFCFVPTNG